MRDSGSDPSHPCTRQMPLPLYYIALITTPFYDRNLNGLYSLTLNSELKYIQNASRTTLNFL